MASNRLKPEIHKAVASFKGRAAVMVEFDETVIDVAGSELFPAASLIKIPILIEGYRQKELGKMNFQQLIHMPKKAKARGAGVLQALSDEAAVTIQDLMTLMIIVSDNTATNILIDLLGADKINQCIKTLPLSATELNRKMMDFRAIIEGRENYTCAKDIVVCLKAITGGSFLNEASRKEMFAIMQNQQFMDKLPAMMDRQKVTVAGKTGELPGLDHDCAVIRCSEKTVYAAVLTDSFQGPEEGKQLIRHIGKLIYDSLIM